jgi:phosphate:Na+ symporter
VGGTEALIEIAGYVALLLWGLHMVQTGMVRGLGGRLRNALRVMLGNRFRAFGSGLAVTALLQSSTATALMLAGFLGSGFVTYESALAATLGANVGTTLIVQLLTFDLSAVIPALILAGVIAFKRAERTRMRDLGRVAIGLGLILLALRLMGALLTSVEHTAALKTVFTALAGDPVIAIALGALLTWAAYSSVAIVLLVMSLAAAGVLTMPSALAFVIGANLGNTIPQFVSSARAPAARRLAVGNLIARGTGAVLALPFLPEIAAWLTSLVPSPAPAIALFHTLFNLALAILFLPILDPLSRLCSRLVPSAPTGRGAGAPRYVSEPAPATLPSVAIADAARETLRVADIIERMLDTLRKALDQDDRKLLAQVSKLDKSVDDLYRAIKLYLVEIGNQAGLDEEDRQRCMEILDFVINLEHAGDVLDKSLREIVAKKIKYRLSFSKEGHAEIDAMLDRVLINLKLAVSVFMNGEQKCARQLLDEKVHIRDLERQMTENHLRRLQEQRPESLETSSIHIDIARDLKRITSHFASVAYPILEKNGVLRRTRLID